jgi:hypothetical protein
MRLQMRLPSEPLSLFQWIWKVCDEPENLVYAMWRPHQDMDINKWPAYLAQCGAINKLPVALTAEVICVCRLATIVKR